MVRLSIYALVFVLTLSAGLIAVWLSAVPSQPMSPFEFGVGPINTTSPPKNVIRTLVTQSPEFTDLDVDEDGSGPQLVLSPVFKGESAICRSEKPSFSKRSALVLFKRGEKFSLERTPLTLRELRKTETSAFYPIKFKDSTDALFLLSDNGSLRPGAVQTLYLQPWNSDVPDDELFFDGLRIGDSRSYWLGDKNYTVRVSAGPSSTNHSVAELILETPNQKQMFWYEETLDKENEIGELEWIGDLDGDDRLDLLFRYFELNGGGSVDVLLLSTHAVKGNLIGPAAFSFARGCR